LGNLSAACEPFVEETWRYKSLHFKRSDVQSRMLKRKPYKLVLRYTRTMMGFLLFNSQPQRIAMLGLGGGSMAKFCYRELPDARIDVIEINPGVIALRDVFLLPPDDDRFCIHLDDGEHFIAQANQQFDVLLVDAYARQGLPQRLASEEFYDSCRNALVEGGVMVVNLYCGHVDAYIARIWQSFGGAMFSVHEKDGVNQIVFACAGDGFQHRVSVTTNALAQLTPDGRSFLKRALRRVAAAMRTEN